nr:hypothetical protein Itr_chr06CG17150 [Ipomoea trifida]
MSTWLTLLTDSKRPQTYFDMTWCMNLCALFVKLVDLLVKLTNSVLPFFNSLQKACLVGKAVHIDSLSSSDKFCASSRSNNLFISLALRRNPVCPTENEMHFVEGKSMLPGTCRVVMTSSNKSACIGSLKSNNRARHSGNDSISATP